MNTIQLPENQSAGACVLERCDDKTAALIMAIIADDLKLPLNKLIFKSIRRI